MSSGAINLRDYQDEAYEALCWDLRAGIPGVAVLPTGSGKSLILAAVTNRAIGFNKRTLILAPAAELVEQDFDALKALRTDAPASKVCAILGPVDLSGQAVFATPHSIYKGALGFFDFVLIDEAHRLGPDDSSMLSQILRALRETNPALRLVGATATPFRGDGGRLIDGPHFEKISYEVSYLDLVRQGYLAKLVGPAEALRSQFDVSGIKVSKGDFDVGQMGQKFGALDTNAAIAAEIARLGHGRQSLIVFCCTKEHAADMAAALNSAGINAAYVTGDTETNERRRILTEFKTGQIRALCGVDVFATGFDAPNVDLIALCRPTQSPVTFVQQLGRGTRIAPGKDNCLVLDFAGNFRRLGPFDDPQIPDRREDDSRAKSKQCFSCDAVVSIGARVCPYCSTKLIASDPTPRAIDIDIRPDFDSPLTRIALQPETVGAVAVRSMEVFLHEKADAADSVRLRFKLANGRFVDEWLTCWHHKAHVSALARQRWLSRWPGLAVPATAAQAVALLIANLSRCTPAAVEVSTGSSKFSTVRFVKVADAA
ncbi:DEAD/DEAH box helicase family protein [Rhizobiales bacterium TNE-4]|nr:DEAD/DEAH box helicase family protein [Rhizobiales bacterium TNE-4]MBV1827113.1 DEAD/DEAH box helicase [Rhizobiales bacterium TNE-4]